MKHANRMLLWAFIFSVTTQASSAQDWPQWRGSNRDGKAIGFTAPAAWPEKLTLKWKVDVGDGAASPALVGDRLYVFARQGADEILRCLDAGTGSEIWQDKYAAAGATGPASSFSGPRASPTVADGKVVTYGVRGVLSCFDADSGKLLWRKDDSKDAAPRFFTSSSPIVVNGLCIAQLGDDNDGAITAFDLTSGEQVWKWSGDGAAYASPELVKVDGTDYIIAETSQRIVGIAAADGRLAWEIPYPVTGRGYNAATPIVHAQVVIYTGSNRGAKAVQLERRGENLAGRELWDNQDNSVQFNTPVLREAFLYGLSSRDVLFCVNARTGETEWTAPIGMEPDEQPAPPSGRQGRGRRPGRGGRGRGGGGFGSIVNAGSVLFALTPTAQLTVFAPSNKEFHQLASYKVSEGRTYAHPIIAGNRMYVKDDNSIMLWTIE